MLAGQLALGREYSEIGLIGGKLLSWANFRLSTIPPLPFPFSADWTKLRLFGLVRVEMTRFPVVSIRF